MEKNSMVISGVIVLIVIGVLVFITINRKTDPVSLPENVQDNAAANNTNSMNNEESTNNPSTTTETTKGVKVTVLKEGTGAVAKSGDTVAMNYTGTLTNGTTFDSNVDPKFQHVQPFVFTIGAGQVIKGWDVGVAGMKVGEKRKLELTPDYAYGSAGAGGAIPPNATLVFEVELLAIK